MLKFLFSLQEGASKLKKGEIREGIAEKVFYGGKGRINIDGETVYLKNVLPGQRVAVRLTKKRSDHWEARLLEVIENSPLETREPICDLFPECGGCSLQRMEYARQLELKEKQIIGLLSPVLTEYGQDAEALCEGISASPKEYPYRNKMEYTFGDAEKDGELTLGLHKKNSNYDILSASCCAIMHPDAGKIVSCVEEYAREKELPYYRKMQHTGLLRNLLVRRSETNGGLMIGIVTTTQIVHDFSELAGRLLKLELEGEITGILHMEFDSLADTVGSDRTTVLYGTDCLKENVCGLEFTISTFSFFQTNSSAAEVLYKTAAEYIGIIENALVFDLYSGTGTIAQILSPHAGRVIGVEIVPEAVEAARKNARLNGICNCEFICGDVLKVLDEIEEKPDFLVLDPPRDGIHPKALPKIIDYGVERIVYISCKPTSLARDLKDFFEAGYRVEKFRCVDMFPETLHVETVCCLYHQKKDFVSVTYEPKNADYLKQLK